MQAEGLGFDPPILHVLDDRQQTLHGLRLEGVDELSTQVVEVASDPHVPDNFAMSSTAAAIDLRDVALLGERGIDASFRAFRNVADGYPSRALVTEATK